MLTRNYTISLTGRVKNFTLPKSKPLIPLYEAVVNSLHAIEERRKEEPNFNGCIQIKIVRTSQISSNSDEISSVEGFEIVDNGIGFTKENMDSFFESDSTYKSKIGGKGVGRFTWLKAFSYVTISSVFFENGMFQRRNFYFSLEKESVDDIPIEEGADEWKTIVELCSYKDEYKKSVPKEIEKISMYILHHCLVYFLDDSCPQIVIRDNSSKIILNDLFKEKVKSMNNTEKFSIENTEFELLHVKIEDESFQGNYLYLCANNRLVDRKSLEKHIVNLDKQIFERMGFWYVGVLTSKYLDQHVEMERISFDIPEKKANFLNEISLETIINESRSHIERYLEKYLSTIMEEKKTHIKAYVTNDAPKYRHLLKYMPDEISQIKPNLSDEKLDEELSNIKRAFDKKSRLEQQELLKKADSINMSSEEYERYFKEEIKKISDANSAMLADYVTHRRVIIELLAKGIRRKEDGKFNKENYIHNLIYPMRATSDDIDYETHNLWLIDEKLSYCTFISSDIHFGNNPSQERADILMLDNPVAISDNENDGTVFDTIIIFELKRPMREDYTSENNPINQLYSYVRKIRSGKAKDKYGRIIHVNGSTKFYLYAICDMTPSLLPFIENGGFKPTPDNLGYYDFNERYNAYFEILSYDKMLNDTKKRNRVLFDKLGLEK